MLSYKAPKNVSEIRNFLGPAEYYRRFIEGFSKIFKPMTKLQVKIRSSSGWPSVSLVSKS
jgi:hypothetical protein